MLVRMTPSRVFAALVPVNSNHWDENEPGFFRTGTSWRSPEQGRPASREVQVTGTAELSAAPDRARVSVLVSSGKKEAGEAKNSVCRRLDYILQVIRQQGIQEMNVTVTKDFRRIENAYHMEAEVCVVFTDFEKMQNICNLLVEKLTTSVTINPPTFYHSAEAMEDLR
uniref:Interleukin 1 receptor associated kinase 1 binding protein 1 n=1 Tax=Latimeria chalumnae TaxID=7897 RepID=H2ZSG3_LATCH